MLKARGFGLAFSAATAKEIKDKDYLPENYEDKLQQKLNNKKGGPRKMLSNKTLEKLEFL
jgi:hypothetical protein